MSVPHTEPTAARLDYAMETGYTLPLAISAFKEGDKKATTMAF